jgi:hypothetical protein
VTTNRTVFTELDAEYWRRRMSLVADPDASAGWWPLVGRLTGVSMTVGIYVAVDGDTCLYVGKIRRHDEGIDRRIARHHQPVETWEGVWLLPMRQSTPDVVVRHFELAVIARHQPVDNVVGRRRTDVG